MSFHDEAYRASLDRRAPRLDGWRVLAAFTPSAWSTTLALVGLSSLLPAAGIAVFLVVVSPREQAGLDEVFMASLLLGMFGFPPAALGMTASAVAAGRSGARAVLLALAAGLVFAGATSCGVSGEIPSEAARGTAFLTFAIPYGFPGVLLGLTAGVSLAMTPGRLRRAVDDERDRRAIELLLMGGTLPLEDLERGLGTDAAGAREVLERLREAGRLQTRVDRGRVGTAERIGRRHALLLAEIERRGEVELSQLEDLVREPADVLRGWLGDLTESGVLDAAIEGATVRFKALEPFKACGGCGGPVRAVGGKLGRCGHCGNEAIG